MAPDRPQKIVKAASAGHTDGVKSRWEKMSPPNTNRFLTHCRGRSETRRAPGMRGGRLEADHVRRLGRDGSRRVAGVDDQGRGAHDGRPVVARVRGEHE